MSGPRWPNRRDAGAELAGNLTGYAGPHTLVLGIPRGGLVVAAEVARRLGAELDVMVVGRMVAPHNRELTIGAVTANGGRLLNIGVIRRWRVSEPYVGAATQVQRGAALAQDAWLRTFRTAAEVTGRTVILVDEAMQSGATMRAAAAAVRRRLPGRVVAAVPVGTRRACGLVAREVNELVCIHQSERVRALSEFYRDDCPPGENEMRALLEGAQQLQEV